MIASQSYQRLGRAGDSAQPELITQLKSRKRKVGVKANPDLRWRARKSPSLGAMSVGFGSLGAIAVGRREKSHIPGGDRKDLGTFLSQLWWSAIKG